MFQAGQGRHRLFVKLPRSGEIVRLRAVTGEVAVSGGDGDPQSVGEPGGGCGALCQGEMGAVELFGSARRYCVPATRLRECQSGPEMTNFERITVDPAQMDGVPCVRHLRIPVATVLRLLAGGLTEREILAEYPDLETEDIRECLRFAASSVMERELPLPRSA